MDCYTTREVSSAGTKIDAMRMHSFLCMSGELLQIVQRHNRSCGSRSIQLVFG